ncbi:hypothetical protein H4217_005154 [Coemansia sp. RSA 1939]|nr:hypothetical protein H4217_005154 [Coemansia sp. RSA 1939]
MSRVLTVEPYAAEAIEKDAGIGAGVGAGGLETCSSENNKRKHSTVFTTSSGDFDLSLLDPPRPGRPPRTASQDPALQEARKRARVLRNRAAAQLSREKKRNHLESLEQENMELRVKNQELEERLGRAEESNTALSSKLETLSQQLQGLQTLFLSTQKQGTPSESAALPVSGQVPGSQQNQQQHGLSMATTAAATSSGNSILGWNSLTASPFHHSALSPPASHTMFASATLSAASTSTPTLAALDASPSTASLTTSSSPQRVASSTSELSGSSLLTAMTDAIATTSPGSEPLAATGIHTSSIAPSSEFSGKDLSESAALEQSGAHEHRAVPDSQQRMPLPLMENTCRRNQRLQKQSLEAVLETYSSTSSSMNWGQRMASLAVAAIMSASPQSSPHSMWTIFCALLWIISQSGGWISKHQVSRIARGISEYPQQHQPQQLRTFSASHRDGGSDIVAALLSKTATITSGGGGRNNGWGTGVRATAPLQKSTGLASLVLLASWLSSGSRTGMALRRVVGDEAVDRVGGLVAELCVATRSINSRRHHRFRTSGAACNKQKLFSPP